MLHYIIGDVAKTIVRPILSADFCPPIFVVSCVIGSIGCASGALRPVISSAVKCYCVHYAFSCINPRMDSGCGDTNDDTLFASGALSLYVFSVLDSAVAFPQPAKV